ncbi:MAG: CoA transferase [Acidimicrobiales bacterium]
MGHRRRELLLGEIMAWRGLDYDTISEVNPRVIYLSVSCFGRNSAWAGKPGYDYIAQAVSGIMHMTGDPDGPPYFVVLRLKYPTAQSMVSPRSATRLPPRTHWRGQYLDISMHRCAVPLPRGPADG